MTTKAHSVDTDNRLRALAEAIDEPFEDLLNESDTFPPYFGEGLGVNVGPSREYYVLTDSEADVAARAYIEESVWAFRPEFLARYMPEGIDYDEAVAFLRPLQEKCEDANKAVRALIGNRFDEFVEDAIASDGRAHFIASYDDQEVEASGFFIYRMN